jgi:hypothetical protein
MKNRTLFCLILTACLFVIVGAKAQTKSDKALDAKINAVIKTLTL